jgi:hypothetical protein
VICCPGPQVDRGDRNSAPSSAWLVSLPGTVTREATWIGGKTTIFYQNVDDFAAINAVYARYMPQPPPARSAPANVNLPRGLLISIDAIAVLPAA